MESRRDSEQHTGGRGNGDREAKHAPVKTKIEVEREEQESLWKQASQPGRQPQADEKSCDSSCERQRQTLRQQLANHPGTSRTDRDPGGNLPLPVEARASSNPATLAHAIRSTIPTPAKGM